MFPFQLTHQAPVSDREYKATLPETASMIDLASNMISEGRGSELMPREANPDSPIIAYRWELFKYDFFLSRSFFFKNFIHMIH